MIENKPKTTHTKNCLMADFSISNWNDIISFIDSNDVYNNKTNDYGLETEPHVTILYGLEPEVKVNSIKSIFNKINKITIKLNGINYFSNESFDVLKFDINSPTLYKLNSLASQYPHTKSFRDYHPHMTIAYLKKGTAKKYEGSFKKGIVKTTKNISYSTSEGKKFYFSI